MALPFSSAAEDVLLRNIAVKLHSSKSDSKEVSQIFELSKCAQWIRENNMQRVALQFPDDLLSLSVKTVLLLAPLVPESKLYILGDTTFGSCCVDEVAAHHASCEGVIHFGHSCLSAPTTLKALLIFGVYSVDWQPLREKLREEDLLDKNLLVFVDTKYCSHLDALQELLPQAIIGRPIVPGDAIPSSDGKVLQALKRLFEVERTCVSPNDTILWIGEHNRTSTSLILYFNSCPIYSYNPENRLFQREGKHSFDQFDVVWLH